MKAIHLKPDDPLYQKALRANEVFERAKVLLDAGYITIKGALFVILLGLEELGVNELDPREVIETLGISPASFYRVKREIEQQEGYKIKSHRYSTLSAGPKLMQYMEEEE